MKKTTLFLKGRWRAALLVLLLSAVGMTKMNAAYDFSAICETGQTLYYTITDAENHYVSITYPGSLSSNPWLGYSKPTGILELPTYVTHVGITYTVTSINTYAFSGCSGLSGAIIIPNTVVSIGTWAFQNCTGLSSVTFGNSLEAIEQTAFYGCSGLSGSLIIPDLVTSIGSSAFSNCSGLTTVVIGNSVVSIGYSAFQNCTNLVQVNWNATNITSYPPYYNPNPFMDCTNLTCVVFGNTVQTIPPYAFNGIASLSSVIIGNSVTSIGICAFQNCIGLVQVNWNAIDVINYPSNINGYYPFNGCTNLASVVLGDMTQTIPPYAFNGITSLSTVTIGNSVVTIGSGAFQDCMGLSSVTFGNSIENIGDNAFSHCSGLTGSLVLPDLVTSIGASAFSNCSGLTSVVIPSSVTTIGESAFSHCSGLTGALVLPDLVTSIGASAFSNCSGLTSVVFGYSLEIIGEYAFYNCGGLTGSLVIPDSTASIGTAAFAGCSGLLSVTISNSLETIGTFVFDSCSGLIGTLIIPDLVTSIDAYAFRNCSGLTSVVFGNSVTSIGSEAFFGCSGFTGSLIIPSSVTTIGAAAFDGCSGFTGSLVIPSSVTSIGNGAFNGCSFDGMDINMANIPYNFVSRINGSYSGPLIIGDSVITIGYSAFLNCSGFTGNLSIGNSVTSIGGSAFSGCNGFTGSLIIGNSVTSIGGSAFFGCSGFSGSLTIPNSVTTISQYAFCNCSSLQELTLGEGLTTIDGFAFWACPSLSTVHFNATNCTQMHTVQSGSYYSVFPTSITTLTIGDNVTNVPDYAFEGSAGLESVVIPNSVTAIGANAFIGCGIQELTIGECVTTIGDKAFWNCPSLTTVHFNAVNCTSMLTYYNSNYYSVFSNNDHGGNPAIISLVIGGNVTKVPYYAFKNAKTIQRVILPNSVTEIGNSAFYDCSGIVLLTIQGSGMNSVGDYAFYNCSNMAYTMNLPNLDYIGSYAFYNCSAMTGTAVIPSSATSIGQYTYYNCVGLTGSLTMPESVTSIGAYAFYNCSGITGSLTMSDNVSSIGQYAFYNCSGLTGGLVIPRSATSIGQHTFSNCSGLTGHLIIPKSITSIGAGAFRNCSGISSVISECLNSPTAQSSSFQGMTYDIPVYVPFGMVANYQSAIGWNVFTNYIEQFQFEQYVTDNWSDAINWYNGGLPTQNDVVCLNSNCQLDINSSILYLYFRDPNLTLTIKSGKTLYVAYGIGLDNPSQLIIEEGGHVVVGNGTGFNISVLANPIEGGSVIGAGTYNYGTTITLTATANEGYTFDSWTKDGEAVSTDADYTFMVTENATLVANFELNSYSITVTANPTNGGTVTGTGTYDYGATATLSATANEGYTFVNWTKNGEVVSTQATYSFTVTEAGAYIANFTLNTYEVTAVANPTNGGTVTGAGTYDHGATATLTATVNDGYTFVNWTKDGEEVATTAAYSFTVTEAGDYVANFTLNSYDITATANPAEGGTVAGAGNFNHGQTCTLTATPATGYTFTNWTKNGQQVSANAIYSFTITESASYVANFNLNSYTITASANPGNGGTVSGAGTYNYGSICTLTASPNTDYVFSNWTESGSVVSSSASYSFTVGGNRSLVANFVYIPQSYTVSVSANPSDGGTVTGGGTYEEGQTCTLTAQANAGYVFYDWTDATGTTVTNSSSFTFTVTESASYVANFTEAASDFHWDVNVSTYPNTLTMVGVIEINSVEQMTTTLEIGAFCGDECRGRDRLVDTYYQVFGHYFVFLTVYGNDGDQINFRLYDHAIGQELDLTCSPLVFQTNGLFGNPGTPYVFDFSISQITQTTDLTTGWNWWSTYVEADDLFNQLKAGLGANATQIKSSTTFVNYFNGMWIGGLSSINNESCYLIKANNACTVEMTGNPAAPANHPITINPNWNWIGYPNTGAQSVANAFSNFTPANGDQVKSQNAFATYYGGMWIGGLNTITPGMGLLYKSNSTEAMTLIYPEPNRSVGLVENVTNEDNHWTADYHAYPGNMTVIAVIELDDMELQGENYELAAFADGECRGSARLMYVAPINRYIAFLTIVGDEASELRFSLYDSETGVVETQDVASLQYETNATMGSLETPYVVRFRSTTGMDEWADNVNIFPNPVNRGERFSLGMTDDMKGSVQVEIVNALGMVVETQNLASPQDLAAPKVAGVYTLRIIVEGKETYCRKLVVK